MGSERYQRDGLDRTSGIGFGLTVHGDLLDAPLRWKTPRRVFVNSMSDLFHPEVPDEFIAAVFSTMVEARQHQFQVLTKRADRLEALAAELPWPPNVWMGVSIENKSWVARADRLRNVPAAVRFISAEPLLGPLDNLDLDGIDWVITGGESGPRHRIVDAHWIRSLRDRCRAHGVPFFFKQWGGHHPTSGGRLLDGRQWSQWPRPKPRSSARLSPRG